MCSALTFSISLVTGVQSRFALTCLRHAASSAFKVSFASPTRAYCAITDLLISTGSSVA
jgi:hypothetical protein